MIFYWPYLDICETLDCLVVTTLISLLHEMLAAALRNGFCQASYLLKTNAGHFKTSVLGNKTVNIDAIDSYLTNLQ